MELDSVVRVQDVHQSPSVRFPASLGSIAARTVGAIPVALMRGDSRCLHDTSDRAMRPGDDQLDLQLAKACQELQKDRSRSGIEEGDGSRVEHDRSDRVRCRSDELQYVFA